MTRHLVLVGAGHAHAQVLKDWAATPVPGVALTVVSPSTMAPYSGMVPGWLAGTYPFAEICIDFAALARSAGARWVTGEVAGINAAQRSLHLASGSTLGFDLLSLNVGSTLLPPQGMGAQVLSLRPLGGLQQAWDALIRQQQQQQGASSAPIRHVTAVGGGAAGFESLLAVLARLRRMQPGHRISGRLVTRGTLLPGMAAGAVRAAHAALLRAGVQVQTGARFDPAHKRADELLLWATGAQAHAWQRGTDLAVSERGYFSVQPSLQVTGSSHVYAVGDCAAWAQPLPKAGVFAVHMGPVLSHNLRAALTGTAMNAYQPQRRYLALLATADHSAIAARGRWSLHGPVLGPLLWRWKDHIDRGFLRRFAGRS